MKSFLIGLAVAVAALILVSPFAGNFIDEDRIKPIPLSVCQETAKELHMTVTSQIGLYTFNSFFHNAIYLRAKNIPELHVHINSRGGCVRSLIGILDILASLKADGFRIVTYARCTTESAAVPIFLMGDTRIVFKNAQLMLHSFSGAKNPKFVSKTTTRLTNMWFARYVSLVAAVTQLTEDEVTEIMTGNPKRDCRYFTSKEALDLDFATEIR